MRRHVRYESLLERNQMLFFDFDSATKCYLEQPVKLRFKAGSKNRVHVPDLLVWREGAAMVLCDVKPKALVEERNFPAQSAAATRFCAESRIEYAVLCEPDETTLSNLRWLHGYFQVPFLGTREHEAIVECLLSGPARIDELLKVASTETLAKPVIFAALWWREILCDLTQPLDRSTLVWLRNAN